MKLNLHFFPPASPGFRRRRCQCWRAQSWGWSSSSRSSWTRDTGRAREAGRALTHWLMSLRSGPKFFSLTSTHMGSESSRWMSEGPDYWETSVVFSLMSWLRMFFLHTGAQLVIAGCCRPVFFFLECVYLHKYLYHIGPLLEYLLFKKRWITITAVMMFMKDMYILEVLQFNNTKKPNKF